MKTESLIVALAIALTSHSYGQSIGTNLVVETFAGSAFQGTVDGQGAKTMFDQPGPIAFGDDGNSLLPPRLFQASQY
jgi:hypothetical protein